jgi:ABC-2 type transport system ATP-binding protein
MEYEAHLANSLNGWIPELPAGVELIDRTENSLRFRVLQPEVVNPLLMRQLMDHQMDIVAFQQVPRSLEDAYLQAVSQMEQVHP